MDYLARMSGENDQARMEDVKENELGKYRVSKKKVLHKSEEKMHKKMKMTSQRAENLVHVQQHHGESFYKKKYFFYIAFCS